MLSLFKVQTLYLGVVALVLSGCAGLTMKPGIGRAIDWSNVPGWNQDHHDEAWPALLHSCTALAERDEQWHKICAAAESIAAPQGSTARRFFEQWFEPHPVTAGYGRRKGLITGYYEPLLQGSLTPDNQFRYPLHGRPQDLLVVDLGELYPELKGKRIRGRLQGRRVVPYYDRRQLETNPEILAKHTLLWVDDPVDLFFLHVQGSGRIILKDKTMAAVGYADQNGHPYRSIGRELVAMGELTTDEVDLFSIRAWLAKHPGKAQALLQRNPSYVFFTLRDSDSDGPRGSLNVPLTAERSIAVDRTVVPLGTPVWLDTKLPATEDGSEPRYRRLVLAQDTGGAIKGKVRADLFWGRGERARTMAGKMKQEGRLYVLLPRATTSGE